MNSPLPAEVDHVDVINLRGAADELQREVGTDDVGEARGDDVGLGLRPAASTITRTTGSVPLGRSSTRPVVPSSASAAATAACSGSAAVDTGRGRRR